MPLSPEHALALLEHYKYWIIFPIAIVEGPIIMVISGFLVFLGILNPYATYGILVVGDLVGDSIYYTIGRFWRKSVWVKKIGYFIGYNENSEKNIEDHFQKHLYKTLFFAKFSHGIGGTIQASSGIARVNFFKYLWINFIGILPKTLILMTIGFYLGEYYLRIDGYMRYIAFFTIGFVLIVVLYFVFKKHVKRFLGKE